MIIYKLTQSTPIETNMMVMSSSYRTPRIDKCTYYVSRASAEAKLNELNAALDLLGMIDVRLSIDEITVIE